MSDDGCEVCVLHGAEAQGKFEDVFPAEDIVVDLQKLDLWGEILVAILAREDELDGVRLANVARCAAVLVAVHSSDVAGVRLARIYRSLTDKGTGCARDAVGGRVSVVVCCSCGADPAQGRVLPDVPLWAEHTWGAWVPVVVVVAFWAASAHAV